MNLSDGECGSIRKDSRLGLCGPNDHSVELSDKVFPLNNENVMLKLTPDTTHGH